MSNQRSVKRVNVEIVKEGHEHKGEACAKGDKINVTSGIAKRMEANGTGNIVDTRTPKPEADQAKPAESKS